MKKSKAAFFVVLSFYLFILIFFFLGGEGGSNRIENNELPIILSTNIGPFNCTPTIEFRVPSIWTLYKNCFSCRPKTKCGTRALLKHSPESTTNTQTMTSQCFLIIWRISMDIVPGGEAHVMSQQFQ